MLRCAGEHHSEQAYLGAALALLREAGNVEQVFFCRFRESWRVVASTDPAGSSPPAELLSDALDREVVVGGDDWRAALAHAVGFRTPRRPEVLAFQASGGFGGQPEKLLADAAGYLALGLFLVRERIRASRVASLLEATLGWRRALETDELLRCMAEVSTKLLEAERASIFLWDRANHLLIGRPALGVEGGVLRIPDDSGIVARVVRGGEVERADQVQGGEGIDHAVDKKLGFQTRSILCVPLWKDGKTNGGAFDDSGEIIGAFEMINKVDGLFTIEDEHLLKILAAHAAAALEDTRQYEELSQTHAQVVEAAADEVSFIGECPAVEALRTTIRRIADTDLTVMILGENGVGKDVAARLTHYWSSRRDKPFIAVNCAAVPDSLLESELFGHEKGAFTDARERRAGKFELASGGALFLDEIGDMSLAGQAKLLRVLEDKTVVRVGGSESILVDTRVIAATNQNLATLVRERKFREDLFFRLSVVTLEVPPLRERGADLLLLADHFLTEFCAKARRKKPRFTAAAKKKLLRHAWPGNIRELRNWMERLVYLTSAALIDVDELAAIAGPAMSDESALYHTSLAEATRQFQKAHLEKQIAASGGNMSEAARRLGLHRSNLYRKMRQLGFSDDSDSGDNAADHDHEA